MIKNMFYKFSLDKQNIIKYGLSLRDNLFSLNVPIDETNKTVKLNIEVNNINEFKIKKIFVSNVINDKDKLLQLRNNN
jgi:hypothetical protein|tara:strand:- start:467 stop:700 length:234 start_codon:yes stop_codon:yes gene_type:complete